MCIVFINIAINKPKPLDNTVPEKIVTTPQIRVNAVENVCSVYVENTSNSERQEFKITLTPKTETAYNVYLQVIVNIDEVYDENIHTTKVINGIKCDSPDTGVFSRDGYVCVQNLTETRTITLWPNFDDIEFVGTPKSINYIDVHPATSVKTEDDYSCMLASECKIFASLDGDYTMHINGTITNTKDYMLKNVRILFTTKAMHGGIATRIGREDIPWSYGGEMIEINVGDIAAGQQIIVDEYVDVSTRDIRQAFFSALFADDMRQKNGA